MKYDLKSKAEHLSKFNVSRVEGVVSINGIKPSLYWNSLVSIKNGFLDEYEALLKLGTTEAIRILSLADKKSSQDSMVSIKGLTQGELEDVEYAYELWRKTLEALRDQILLLKQVYSRNSQIKTNLPEGQLSRIYDELIYEKFISGGTKEDFVRIMSGKSYLVVPEWKNVATLKDFFTSINDKVGVKNQWSYIIKVFDEINGKEVTSKAISKSNSISNTRDMKLRQIISGKKR